MAIFTEDMKHVVRNHLGFFATVCEDGSPNLSPKGCSFVWDDDHLFFGDIRSPQTVANVRRGSLVEMNVVDPFLRKGYRFKGPAVVHDRGSEAFARGIELLRGEGVVKLLDRVRAIIVIEVREVRPLLSPAYDDGTTTEVDLLRIYKERFAKLYEAVGK